MKNTRSGLTDSVEILPDIVLRIELLTWGAWVFYHQSDRHLDEQEQVCAFLSHAAVRLQSSISSMTYSNSFHIPELPGYIISKHHPPQPSLLSSTKQPRQAHLSRLIRRISSLALVINTRHADALTLNTNLANIVPVVHEVLLELCIFVVNGVLSDLRQAEEGEEGGEHAERARDPEGILLALGCGVSVMSFGG